MSYADSKDGAEKNMYEDATKKSRTSTSVTRWTGTRSRGEFFSGTGKAQALSIVVGGKQLINCYAMPLGGQGRPREMPPSGSPLRPARARVDMPRRLQRRARAERGRGGSCSTRAAARWSTKKNCQRGGTETGGSIGRWARMAATARKRGLR